jgi:hypothetical protein
MPHRGYRAKEGRSAIIGGTTRRIFIASADEVAHPSGKNEEIPRSMCSTTIDHCPPG